ncbi:MAG: hypothetical protein ACETWK_07655 [Candidatus Aminicenantaceae bacterium]
MKKKIIIIGLGFLFLLGYTSILALKEKDPFTRTYDNVSIDEIWGITKNTLNDMDYVIRKETIVARSTEAVEHREYFTDLQVTPPLKITFEVKNGDMKVNCETAVSEASHAADRKIKKEFFKILEKYLKE